MKIRHPRSHNSLRGFSVLLGLLAITGSLSQGFAETFQWTGAGGSGDFNDSANWSPTGTPGEDDIVNATGNFTTTINIRNTAESVMDWNFDSTTNLSVLGRGGSGSTVDLSITGTLTKRGTGFLAFRDQGATRHLNLEIGTVNMEDGILYFGTTSDPLTALNIGTVNISGGNINMRSVSGATLNISNITFSGEGTINLHETGTGETSTVTTNALNSTGAAGTITTSAANTSILRIISTPNSMASYGGTITGTGTSLEKQGSGTQILTGGNSYGGGTSISEGTLLINNTSGTSGTGTGAVLVKSGGVLGGTGFVGSAVTTESSGTSSTLNGHLAPGSNGAGVLTIQNTLTLAEYTHLDYELNAPNVAGGTGGNDLLAVTGTTGANGDVTIGAHIVLNLLSLGENFAPGTYDLISFTGTLTGQENLATWTVEGLSQPYSFGADTDSIYLVVSVPEPSTTALMTGALGGLIYFIRRKAS